MYKISRVLVAVDLSTIDDTLIQYVSRLSNNMALDKVYFLHVVKKLELPEEIVEKYPDMIAPVDESIKKEIQFAIENCPIKIAVDYEIDVVEGHPVEQIIKWSKVKETDTIFLGRKTRDHGEGIISSKIVKLSLCTVAFIPEKLPPALTKVIVPVDFSSTSKLALEFALRISKINENLNVICLNVYNVPSGYHYTGKTYEEFADIMKNNAKRNFERFIKDIDTEGARVESKFVLDEDDNVPRVIYNVVKKENVNGIIMGSKGRTDIASILVGSVAEKIMRIEKDTPLFIVKGKKHNMDFMDAIMKI